METVKRIVIKRVDGAYMSVRFTPAENMRSAARFSSIDDYNNFMNGHYRPDKPELYKPQTIQIEYKELDDSERDEEPVPEN